MNVLSLCGPESGIPKNPSVRLLSYSKASEKVSVKLLLRLPLLLFFSFVVFVLFSILNMHRCFKFLTYLNEVCLCRAGGFLIQ